MISKLNRCRSLYSNCLTHFPFIGLVLTTISIIVLVKFPLQGTRVFGFQNIVLFWVFGAFLGVSRIYKTQKIFWTESWCSIRKCTFYSIPDVFYIMINVIKTWALQYILVFIQGPQLRSVCAMSHSKDRNKINEQKWWSKSDGVKTERVMQNEGFWFYASPFIIKVHA